MIENYIAETRDALPVFWPLQSFIATNPVWDLHDKPFREVISKLKHYAPIEGVMPISFYQKIFYDGKITIQDLDQAIIECHKHETIDVTTEQFTKFRAELFVEAPKQPINTNKCRFLICELINDLTNKDFLSLLKTKILIFLTAYFAREQPLFALQHENGLYDTWVQVIANNDAELCTVLNKLPASKFAAIEQLCVDLKILPDIQVDYFTKICFQLLGWCSLIKWLELHPNNPFIKVNGTLADIILIWLCYESVYSRNHKDNLSLQGDNSQISNNNSSAEIDSRLIWQRAYELVYERELLDKLHTTKINKTAGAFSENSIQAIFCIDTRSEGIRRHLEKQSGYITYGYAGFFGFVFQYHLAAESSAKLQCPALFPPEVNLHSEVSMNFLSEQYTQISNTLNNAKKSLAAPFALVELTGLWHGLTMLVKSLLPTGFRTLKKLLKLDRHNNLLNTIISANQVNTAFDLRSKVNNSVQFLKTIGLTKGFAPLILICGHGGETENNPYQASFDCGACGGNAGYANAIVVCHILNDKIVREGIKMQGIDLPDTSYFIAGFHNTTRDEINLYEQDLPSTHEDLILQLKNDLNIVTSALKQERCLDLPGNFKPDNRSCHWAELIPEMGLIKNAALIIGPRHLTEGVSLDRRVFLHSYEPSLDWDGKLLTNILSGPLIVAHWINAQYYFSTTDPMLYGAGNKMLHNVINGIGVMEGNLSDLKIGLPWQSIAFQEQIVHEPLRLLVIIYASKQHVDAILQQYPNINAIFHGGWAHLKIIEPS